MIWKSVRTLIDVAVRRFRRRSASTKATWSSISCSSYLSHILMQCMISSLSFSRSVSVSFCVCVCVCPFSVAFSVCLYLFLCLLLFQCLLLFLSVTISFLVIFRISFSVSVSSSVPLSFLWLCSMYEVSQLKADTLKYRTSVLRTKSRRYTVSVR